MNGRRTIPDGVPAYEFIKRELKQLIDTGALSEGDRVPSELDYAQLLGVSRGQTRQALRELEVEGYLRRYPGRGSFVAPAAERARRAGLTGMRMIAMACPIISSFHVRAVIEGFSTRLQAEDIQTVTYFLGVNENTEARLLADIRHTGVEGLALWKDKYEDAAHERALLERFRATRFPFVLCDRYLEGFDADFVGTDNHAVGYSLTRALLDEGHTRIGFLALAFNITTSKERLEGYREALAEAGLDFVAHRIGALGVAADNADAVVMGLLACQARPTALLCADEKAAGAALAVLHRRGYRVPEDMRLACVNDGDNEDCLGVPVIQARQQSQRIGQETADVLLARMENPDRPPETRLIPAQLLPDMTSSAVVHQKGGDSRHKDYPMSSSASV